MTQTHSIQGACLATPDDCRRYQPYCAEGDYLITPLPHIGLGIVTADCLPIIIYDHKNHVSAAMHAGWRGSINLITHRVMQDLKALYNSNPLDLLVFFGPSAKACCYTVDEQFAYQLRLFPLREQALFTRNQQVYFDVPLFNQLQLRTWGIPDENFIMTYNVCTLCNNNFCSYRRDKESAERQITIITLHEKLY